MSLKIVLFVIIGVAFAWLARQTFLAARARKTGRAAYFSKLIPLFDRVILRIEPTGFPRMTAYLGSHAFDLQVIPDSLTYRKLPSLWLLISLPEPLPVQATLDIMTRATGQEPFSRFSTLPHAIAAPSFLPEGTGLRSDAASDVLPEHLVARHAGIFSDPRVKEMVISPKGLRLVIQAEQADRGKYLLFRDAEMGLHPPDAHRIESLIQTMLAMRAEIFSFTEQSSVKEPT